MSHPSARVPTLIPRLRFSNSNSNRTAKRYIFTVYTRPRMRLVDIHQPFPIALFTSNSIPSFNPPPSQVIACQILPDNRELAVILCCGDIVTVSLQEDAPSVRLMTKFWYISSNKCCRRSPLDLSISVSSLLLGAQMNRYWPWLRVGRERPHPMEPLTVIAGDNKLMLMTSTFDVLSEAPLHTDEYGEGNGQLQNP